MSAVVSRNLAVVLLVAGMLIGGVLTFVALIPAAKTPTQTATVVTTTTSIDHKTATTTTTTTGYVQSIRTVTSVRTVLETTTTTAANILDIKVIARQFSWTFIYPNGTAQIGNLSLPAGVTVVFNVTSTDVLHGLGIDSLNVSVDAIPGRYTTASFVVPVSGTYEIRCFELCGIGHASMTATLRVVPP